MDQTKILEITPDVKWIGALDPDLITFDVVMQTKYGTTYNSYFINAQKKVVVDTVKEKFWDSYLAKLQKLVNPADIEYIVAHHTEPDHSGSIQHLLQLAPKAKVLATANGVRYLRDLIGHDFPNIVVKDGEVINLGDKKLQFIGAPNLHWPDSICSYLVEDRLLFSCDIFGCHYCHEMMYDDLVGNFDAAFKYYYDVVLKPFSRFMLKALDKIKPLAIQAICPGHGPILRQNWSKYVKLSEEYASKAVAQPDKNRVFIPYVSAYHNTRLLAEKIAEGIRQAGDVEVEVCDVECVELSEVEDKIARSTGLIVGSPTINQNTLLPIYKMFAIVNPIRDRGKLAGAFGSYGWSGEAVKIILGTLTNLKLKQFGDGLLVKFTPHDDGFKQCLEYGKTFGKQMLDNSLVLDLQK